MRRVLLSLAITAAALAQDAGLAAFNRSCAVGYCHGSGGTAGRAPKLLGRAFDHAYVLKVTRDGIPNTGMPGWKDRLGAAELDAVVAWVVNVSGGKLDPKLSNSAASGPAMPADAKRGKDLFFDAVRGEGRCSTCHSLEELGIPIGPNLASGGPYDAATIRNGKPATIRRATASTGEVMSALVVDQQPNVIKVYDLALPLPVLRTFAKGEITFSGAAEWRHEKAVTKYTDADLAAVAAYLRWAAGR